MTTHHTTGADSLGAELLHHFVSGLDSLANPAPLPLPLLIGLGPGADPDEVDVAVTPPVSDIYDALLGLVAPAWWEALLIWVEGSAFRPGQAESGEPVRLLLGLTRGGTSLSRLQSLDGVALPFTANRPSEGLLLDCARRVFELETPPPPPSTVGFHSSLWLDEILALAFSDPDADTGWPTLAALHPARPDVVGDEPSAIANATRRLAQATGWASLRRAAATGLHPELPLSSADAEWMDDGLFARWCLSAFPDPGEAFDDLDCLLDPKVMKLVVEVVEASG